MNININGQEYSEYLQEQEELLTEFNVLDLVRNFIANKLPADISYFNTRTLDEMFREIERNNGQSEDYAYALSLIVTNIGNTARQPSSLDKCYKTGVQYRKQLLTYYNKYKNKLSPIGKAKIRHSIEAQFNHFEINPIKGALSLIAYGGTPLTRMPAKLIKASPTSLAGSTANAIGDYFLSWFAVKYYDLLDAVKVYKKASLSEIDSGDSKSVYIMLALKKESKYFYESALAILQDMLKLYDQL